MDCASKPLRLVQSVGCDVVRMTSRSPSAQFVTVQAPLAAWIYRAGKLPV